MTYRGNPMNALDDYSKNVCNSDITLTNETSNNNEIIIVLNNLTKRW